MAMALRPWPDWAKQEYHMIRQSLKNIERISHVCLDNSVRGPRNPYLVPELFPILKQEATGLIRLHDLVLQERPEGERTPRRVLAFLQDMRDEHAVFLSCFEEIELGLKGGNIYLFDQALNDLSRVSNGLLSKLAEIPPPENSDAAAEMEAYAIEIFEMEEGRNDRSR